MTVSVIHLSQRSLPYLGDRQYVHGSSIFELFAAFADPDSPFDMRIKKVTRQNIVNLETSSQIQSYWPAVFRSVSSIGTSYFGICPVGNNKALRAEFDESKLWGLARLDGDTASIENSPESTIRTATALLKLILKTVVSTAEVVPGQWLLVRYSGNLPVNRLTAMHVSLRRFENNRYAEAEICADAFEGTLAFMWSANVP